MLLAGPYRRLDQRELIEQVGLDEGDAIEQDFDAPDIGRGEQEAARNLLLAAAGRGVAG